MKTTVIYHNADMDGIFCREIARKFIPDAELIGWNFGDPKCEINTDGPIYILDLSPDCLSDYQHRESSLIWIDHHKSSIEKWPSDIFGYRIDGVAACRLAWQWFSKESNISGLPIKEEYLNRTVQEPLSVRLAGEYDVWDHRGDGDLEFQYGLRAQKVIPFELLLEGSERSKDAVDWIIADGQTAMNYARNMDAMWLGESWHIIEWEGQKFLAQNSVQRGSGILDSKDKPETGHTALMLYGFRGKLWTVSMYHSNHRKDLDLSVIAVKHGGGGHKGACGFTCKELPFSLT